MTRQQGPISGKEVLEKIPVRGNMVKNGFYFLILIWLLYLLREAMGWHQWEDYTFVYLVAVPITLLTIFMLLLINYEETLLDLAPPRLRALASSGSTITALSKDEATRSEDMQKLFTIYMSGWVLGTIILLYLVGFYTGTAIAVFSHLLVTTRNPKLSLSATILCLAVVFTFFDVLLRARRWDGELTSSDIVYVIIDTIVSSIF